MKDMSIKQMIELDIEEPYFLNGFDDALIGSARQGSGQYVPCYSVLKMVNNLIRNHNMTNVEAFEFLEVNVLNAYFGDNTPIYLEDYSESM